MSINLDQLPVRPRYAMHGKYVQVGKIMAGQQGTFLDLGARDRILLDYLDESVIEYGSSDIVEGHDYVIDLEQPIPLADQSVDFAAALDVFEHLEHIHQAFAETMRITRKWVFVTLPNMSSIGFRFRFLFQGKLNGKYWLLPEHQGDRHRWLTVFPEIYRFILANAASHGFHVKEIYNLVENKPGFARPARMAARMNMGLRSGLYSEAVLFVLERQHTG